MLSGAQFASGHLARWRRVLEDSQQCKLTFVQFPAMDSDFKRSHTEVKKKMIKLPVIKVGKWLKS